MKKTPLLSIFILATLLFHGSVTAQCPTVGTYANTTIIAGQNATITPSAAPGNTIGMLAHFSPNFTGVFSVSPTTGVLTVTDAKPAGTYTVRISAYNSTGCAAETYCTLTVTNPACSQGLFIDTTEIPFSPNPTSVAVGDFNGDGKQDIAIADGGSTVSIRLGDGAGGFTGTTAVPVGSTPESIAVADFNGDGKQDIATANFDDNTVSIRLGDGSGGFTGTTDVPLGQYDYSPRGIAVADFNSDDKPDLVTVNYSSSNISFFYGDGAGGLSVPSSLAFDNNPTSVAVGDFNGDGYPDCAMAARGHSSVFVLLSGGSLYNYYIGGSPFSVAVGDFNGDGRQDIAAANGNTVSILLGDGAGGFSIANVNTGSTPVSVAVGDFNGDGKQDIVAANGNSTNNTVSILLGNGAGGFSVATNVPIKGRSTQNGGFAVGDFNGDGKQDIAINNSNRVSILFGGAAGINLQGNSTNIVTGSTTTSTANATDFGSVCSSGSNVVQIYTIQNTGNTDLTISSGDITVTGADASGFTIGDITLPNVVAAGASATFTVTFAPSSPGVKSAQINIANNSCEIPSYTYAIGATVTANVTAGAVSGTSPLPVGATATYTSTGTTGGTWSSDNTAVATVNSTSGLVTAVSAGTANIIYTISSGCGAPVSAQKLLTVSGSQATDYYRSITTGNWNAPATWESATNSAFTTGLVSPATLAPDYNANAIIIQSPHRVTVTADVTIDQTTVDAGGTLSILTGVNLSINDGVGWDIVVNGAVNGPGNMTVKSTRTGTASVGNSSGSITVASTVERFIPDDGHRAWRLLSVPTTGSQTIQQAWQDTGITHAGYATLITSNLYTGTNGFDMSSGSSSILQHSQGGVAGPSWIPLTNTNVTTLSSNPGYMLFVRGDRNSTPGNSLIGSTTLRSTGQLYTATNPPPAKTVSSTGTGYTLVCNPYASPVDFESIAGTTNLNQSFYIWDANLAGKYGVGGFRLVERTGVNTYRQTPQNMDGTNSGAIVVEPTLRYLHSGQAFFLKASSSDASVVFTEASKAVDTSVINPFRQANMEPQLLANLLIVEANNTTTLADGIRVRFDNSYSASVTGEDATKMSNFSSENLGLKRENKIMIVEKRPEVTSNDTLFLNLANTSARNYRFQLSSQNMPSTLMAYLVDKYLNTQTVIDLTTITNIDFSVNAVVASSAVDRFMIVFKTASTLPVTLSSIKAYQKANDIAVEWKVQNESVVKQYEVEKSTDGRMFSKGATQIATGNNSTANYVWVDVNAITGNNFYRIKSIGLNGEIRYSEVVKVTIGKDKADYSVYPNPLVTNTINLQFVNQPKGEYILRLLNHLGQVMLSKQITHEPGSSSESVELSYKLAKGNYLLEITAPDNTKRSLKIIR